MDYAPNQPRIPMVDETEIKRLNEEYVRASLTSDVAWFEEHLDDEFVCIESDGSLLDRSAFLAAAAKPSALADYRFASVDVRLFGSVALVRAHGLWTAKTGAPGASRYVDVYARSGGEWKAVSAQITRPATNPA